MYKFKKLKSILMIMLFITLSNIVFVDFVNTASYSAYAHAASTKVYSSTDEQNEEKIHLQNFRSSIKEHKDVGDHVCPVNGYWDGYVEKVHKDKLQVRVQTQQTSGSTFFGGTVVNTQSDTLIWVKYNEVGVCEYNINKYEETKEFLEKTGLGKAMQEDMKRLDEGLKRMNRTSGDR